MAPMPWMDQLALLSVMSLQDQILRTTSLYVEESSREKPELFIDSFRLINLAHIGITLTAVVNTQTASEDNS
jgi:hypothetical protein